MYRIIGTDGKEYGPVNAEQIKRWIVDGRVNAQTQIHAEGAPEWKTVGELPEFSTQVSPQPPVFAPDHDLGGGIRVSAEALLAGEVNFSVVDCLSQAWALLMNNFGLLVGATVLVWLLESAIAFIPFLGGIFILLLQGVLHGGLYLIYLKRIRGESATLGDAFSGFSTNFAQLMLVGLVTRLLSSLAMCCLILPAIYLMVAWLFSIPLVADKRVEFWSAMEVSRKVVNRVWFQIFGLLLICGAPYVIFTGFAVFKGITIALAIIPRMQSGAMDPSAIMSMMGGYARRSRPISFNYMLTSACA